MILTETFPSKLNEKDAGAPVSGVFSSDGRYFYYILHVFENSGGVLTTDSQFSYVRTIGTTFIQCSFLRNTMMARPLGRIAHIPNAHGDKFPLRDPCGASQDPFRPPANIFTVDSGFTHVSYHSAVFTKVVRYYYFFIF